MDCKFDTYWIGYNSANKLDYNSDKRGFTETRSKDGYYDGGWSIKIVMQARGIIQSSYDII